MALTLQQFIDKYRGVSKVGNTDANKGECVGLVSLWMDNFAIPHVWGHAKDLYANAPTTHFEKIPKAPNVYPKPGDIIVWNSTWGGGFGHTAVVVSSDPDADSYTVFEQNYPLGATPRIATRSNWSGTVGWLRIKGYTDNSCEAQIKELEDKVSELRLQREGYRVEISDLEDKIDTIQHDNAKTIGEKNEQIQTLQKQASELNATVVSLNKTVKESSDNISELRTQLKTTETAFTDYKLETGQKITDLEELNQNQTKKINKLQIERDELKEKLNARIKNIPWRTFIWNKLRG